CARGDYDWFAYW
nr:immunoglobulin heavy chain junction region [Mus musculus]NSM08087.1 immunoglobulin heavy chain junction region [Mus musculus]NSM08409.1 immunoglobulin heavy chain junction region [Mus musculus]NSM08933.1 immunoglobulin heavy chain junction region [Mus musculus]